MRIFKTLAKIFKSVTYQTLKTIDQGFYPNHNKAIYTKTYAKTNRQAYLQMYSDTTITQPVFQRKYLTSLCYLIQL